MKFRQLFPFSLLYAAFAAAGFGVFILIGRLTGFFNVPVVSLGIVPAVVFYAGILDAARRSFDNEDVTVRGFFRAIGRRLGRFILHGVLAYLCFNCASFALFYYTTLMSEDSAYGFITAVYMLFALLLVLYLICVTLVTVCYDARFRTVCKTAFRLIFKGMPLTLLLLLLFLACGAGAGAAVYFTRGVVRWALAAVFALILPLPFAVCQVRLLKKRMTDYLGDYRPPKPEPQPEITVPTDNTEDDYIFVNGRMIKNPSKKQ